MLRDESEVNSAEDDGQAEPYSNNDEDSGIDGDEGLESPVDDIVLEEEMQRE